MSPIMHPIDLTSPVRLVSGETAIAMGRAFVGIEYHYDLRMPDGRYWNDAPAKTIEAVIGAPRSDIIRVTA